MRPGETVVVGARVLAGESLQAVDGALVAIHEGRVAHIGSSIPVASGTPVVDATGLTLLPGFIDAHVHIGFYDPHFVVAGGVTTARDLAWPPQFIHELVARSKTHELEGPRLLAAGPMLTVPDGYPTRAPWAPPGTGRTVRSPDEGRGAVVRTVDEGADVIKVALNAAAGPTLDGATLTAIVEEAHDLGVGVTGHVDGLDELHKALDAEMDELAHMLMSAERIPDETIARMVDQNMTVVPTLSIRFGRDQRIAVENLERFLAAGGAVVYGTDLGNEGPKPGIDRREVVAMTKAGMSSRDVIASGTVNSARYLGLGSKGVLAPGMDADIVAVAGDPLQDVVALTDVRMVWREGRRLL